MNHKRLGGFIAGMASAFYLTGCVTTVPSHVAAQPVAQSAGQPPRTVVVATPPAKRPLVAARPVVVEEVMPEPADVYIRASANSDVVFIGGNTYIWVTDADGRRHRHFYGHGDRRREVFHRRDNLRSVVAHRSGQAPLKYARHERNDPHEGVRRPQPMHVANTHGHNHPQQTRVAVNDQSHRQVQHRQPGALQNPPVHEVSTEHNGVPRRPEGGVVRVNANNSSKS